MSGNVFSRHPEKNGSFSDRARNPDHPAEARGDPRAIFRKAPAAPAKEATKTRDVARMSRICAAHDRLQ